MGKLIVIILVAVVAVMIWISARRRLRQKGQSRNILSADAIRPAVGAQSIQASIAGSNPPTAKEGENPSTVEEMVNQGGVSESDPDETAETKPDTSSTFLPEDENGTQVDDVDEGYSRCPPRSNDEKEGSLPADSPPISETGEEPISETEPPRVEPRSKARKYSEPKPSPTTRTDTKRERKETPTPKSEASLPISLQLLFGRNGSIRNFALIPHRREGMPNELKVSLSRDRFEISESGVDNYESILISDASQVLSEGVVLQTDNATQRWTWAFGKRDIYVLASGESFGLSGYVTRRRDQRLWMNTRHVVLAKESLRDQTAAALVEAGCVNSESCDSTTFGVPPGWVLFRNVTPTRSVTMRDDRDILNVLCPAHEIEPLFVGGIRLERRDWLAGFPPRIRFAGELDDGFRVLIDNQQAFRASDGAYEAPGWNTDGEHRLWFSDRAETFSLRTMDEGWISWPAYNFGTGATICGANIQASANTRRFHCCVPTANLTLIGSRPGEIFRCRVPTNHRAKWVSAFPPFTPVWALPPEWPSKTDDQPSLALVNFIEPQNTQRQCYQKLRATSGLRQWIFAIRSARRNSLQLAAANEDSIALWNRYAAVARILKRKLR